MSERKTISIIFLILIILIAGVFMLYHYAYSSVEPILSSFTVNSQRNFEATGKRLSKVEIWAIPTGTGVTADDYQLVNTMTLTNSDDQHQEWTAVIPQDPILATQIFAKGYDKQGKVVGTIALPYTGATEIYNALWNATTTLQK